MTRPVILLAGPTGCGKSEMALRLAEATGGAVVNADSMQVYRDLAVLTARPAAEAEARAPHWLYGVLDGSERCSVGRWLELARQAISETTAAGRAAIVSGGTGLYFKALCEGIAPVPGIPRSVREKASALFDRLGGEAFHALLGERDPDAAARLDTGDRQRLIRAWEVLEATGETLTAWRARPPRPPVVAGEDVPRLLLTPPREWVYRRVEARFDAMLGLGAVEEVKALLDRNLDPGLPVMKALGVPELSAHLAGEMSLEQAADKAKMATRRYAKRQMTWFRHQMADWRSFSDVEGGSDVAQDSESIYKKILSIIC